MNFGKYTLSFVSACVFVFLLSVGLAWLAGDGGGGGDGSSGGEGQGSDGGVSVVPLTSGGAQAAYDVTRGLGIVGASGTGGDDDDGFSWPGALGHSEVPCLPLSSL